MSDGFGLRLGDDHQAAAVLVTLPRTFNIREAYALGVYLQFPIGSMHHDSLQGVGQNFASWNPSSAHNCQCGAAKHGSRQCDSWARAFTYLNQASLGFDSRKFSVRYCGQECPSVGWPHT